MADHEADEFEAWLREGKGRIREITPKPHSSYAVGAEVVVNIGSSGLVDDSNFVQGEGEEAAYHVAPVRNGWWEAVGRNVPFYDVVVHPSLLAGEGSLGYLRRLLEGVVTGIVEAWPGSSIQKSANHTRLPNPLRLHSLLLEITPRQLHRARSVYKEARRQANRSRSFHPIKPVRQYKIGVATHNPREIEILFSEGSLEVLLGGVRVEEVSLPNDIYMEQLRAGMKGGAVTVRVYEDEVEARAAALREKLFKVRK